jgi:hypothetical protein
MHDDNHPAYDHYDSSDYYDNPSDNHNHYTYYDNHNMYDNYDH